MRLTRLSATSVALARRVSTRRTPTGPASLAPSVPVTSQPVLGERLVRVGHVERRDALLEAAERHREVGETGVRMPMRRRAGRSRVPTWMPTVAKTELSRRVSAPASV
jgi:hypothetical protein